MLNGPEAAAPRFSVVILTYARDPALARTLARLADFTRDRDDLEVILVDNNLDAVDRLRMLSAFPRHRVVKTGTNAGVSARNDGMAVARGDYLVLLDDDVLVDTPDFLTRLAATFEARPDVGVVNIRKLDAATMTQLPEALPHTDKTVDPDTAFDTFRFIGGLVALRRSVFAQVGGFRPDFFYGSEERELSYRILKAGWRIRYDPEVVALETNDAGGRRSRRDLRTETLINTYIIAYLHKPLLPMLADIVLFTAFLWIRERGQVRVLHAWRRFAGWLGSSGRDRRAPISPAVQAYIRDCGGATWR